MVGKHAGWRFAVSKVGRALVACRSKLALGVACAVLLLGGFAPRTASACSSRTPPPTLSGYPSEGELEVPTDVVPFYETSSLSSRRITEVTLRTSEGDVLAARPAAAQLGIIELTIGTALQPNTQYALEATLKEFEDSDPESLTLTFTTAAGPVSASPAPPEGFLRQFQFTAGTKVSSCDWGYHGTCVVVSAGFPVEATNLYASGEESPYVSLHRKPWFVDLTGLSSNSFGCVKLRTRGANAIYGSPAVLCGADVPIFTIRSSAHLACTSEGLTQDGALVTMSAGDPNESPSGGSDQGGSDQGGSDQGGSDQGGSGQAAAEQGGAAQAGAAQVDAPESPSETSTSCSCGLAPGGKQANAALSALFALALAVRLRRSRRP